MANRMTPASLARQRQAAGVSRAIRDVKVERFDCGIHDISYSGIRPGCPLCDSERENKQLRSSLLEARNKLEMAVNQVQAMRVQIDVVSAIRAAIPLLDDNDLSFFKSVLYMHRDEKSVALKVTHGARRKKRENAPPNGFVVMPRSGEPYGHLCSSVGGLAIAEYYDETVNSVGPAQAMQLLTRGMAPQLPGAIR